MSEISGRVGARSLFAPDLTFSVVPLKTSSFAVHAPLRSLVSLRLCNNATQERGRNPFVNQVVGVAETDALYAREDARSQSLRDVISSYV